MLSPSFVFCWSFSLNHALANRQKLTPPPSFLTPRHTDKILSKFGEGTFGRVLECWDRLERDYVAVKVRERGEGREEEREGGRTGRERERRGQDDDGGGDGAAAASPSLLSALFLFAPRRA